MITFPMGNLKPKIWICTFLVYFQLFVGCRSSPSFTKLSLQRANALGPEAFAFDHRGRGPYTGVTDGRILKYKGSNVGFVDFGITSPYWTKEKCSGANGFHENTSKICGRPEGLSFDLITGHLYVVDRYMGFLVIPPSRGLGIRLAAGFNGANFTFPDAIDIDQASRNVYFTDCGTIFLSSVINRNDTSGKLYKYNIKTAKLTMLLSGLSGPAGLAVSKNGRYLVFSEFGKNRIRRFWLKPPKAGNAETLINLPGTLDNIKRTINGVFWVAMGTSTNQAFVLKFNGSGNILKTMDFSAYSNGHMITEVQEHLGKLYLGSIFLNFFGLYG